MNEVGLCHFKRFYQQKTGFRLKAGVEFSIKHFGTNRMQSFIVQLLPLFVQPPAEHL